MIRPAHFDGPAYPACAFDPILLAGRLEEVERLEGLNPERRREAFWSLGGESRDLINSYFAMNKERRQALLGPLQALGRTA